MKLLLTSAGISNGSIAKGLHELVGRSPSDVRVAFIPTAANVEEGNKDWVINQLLQLMRYGYCQIDIVDPTAAEVDWRARLNEADVLFLSGGNTFYLLDQVRKTGFGEWLEANKNKKVYVGGSASTILVTPTIAVASVEPADPNTGNITNFSGLGWVDFEVSPHVPSFISPEDTLAYAATAQNDVYSIDDSTAILVTDDETRVITEGSWQLHKKPS